MAKKTLSVETLRDLVKYDPVSGDLTWRPRKPTYFADGFHSAETRSAQWNARYAHQSCFSDTSLSGYRKGTILGFNVKAHRVAFAIMEGRWPSMIDHIDGNIKNNAWSNLREVNRTANNRNTAIGSNNTSGCKGVSLRPCGKWRVRIGVGGRRRHIGDFNDLTAAINAKKSAELDLQYHANHGRERN